MSLFNEGDPDSQKCRPKNLQCWRPRSGTVVRAHAKRGTFPTLLVFQAIWEVFERLKILLESWGGRGELWTFPEEVGNGMEYFRRSFPGLFPCRSVSSSNHTGVDSLCHFSPLARSLNRVALYAEFLRLTMNGTRLKNFTLDERSILVDGMYPMGREGVPCAIIGG